jgi:hypothetical protein
MAAAVCDRVMRTYALTHVVYVLLFSENCVYWYLFNGFLHIPPADNIPHTKGGEVEIHPIFISLNYFVLSD